ncbi:unnamed protein product [Symbiodinium natans]|uniref:Uncharacterized protein n=1 Tax=Symbiodinium natans TaxID=878477 RepID=A0A812N521_9DINO|nr:unnamed protein product [Symbiodinium natans]
MIEYTYLEWVLGGIFDNLAAQGYQGPSHSAEHILDTVERAHRKAVAKHEEVWQFLQDVRDTFSSCCSTPAETEEIRF